MAPSRQFAEESPHEHVSSNHLVVHDSATRNVEETTEVQTRTTSPGTNRERRKEKRAAKPKNPRPYRSPGYLRFIYDTGSSSTEYEWVTNDDASLASETSHSFLPVDTENNNDNHGAEVQTLSRSTPETHDASEVTAETPDRAAEVPNYDTDDSLYRRPTPPPRPITRSTVYSIPNPPEDADGERSELEEPLARSRTINTGNKGTKRPRVSFNDGLPGLFDTNSPSGTRPRPVTRRRKTTSTASDLTRRPDFRSDQKTPLTVPITEPAHTGAKSKTRKKCGPSLRPRTQPKQPYKFEVLPFSDEDERKGQLVEAEAKERSFIEQLGYIGKRKSKQTSWYTAPQCSSSASSHGLAEVRPGSNVPRVVDPNYLWEPL